jgi:hypothetical protein
MKRSGCRRVFGGGWSSHDGTLAGGGALGTEAGASVAGGDMAAAGAGCSPTASISGDGSLG